jgi:hypothetical protein
VFAGKSKAEDKPEIPRDNGVKAKLGCAGIVLQAGNNSVEQNYRFNNILSEINLRF